MGDFGERGTGRAERNFLSAILAYLPPEEADLLRGGGFKVDYLDCDWNVNDSRNAR